MQETITEMILPGTYIEVRAEGLISAGQISVGNIGVVGTSINGNDYEVKSISNMTEAKEAFGEYDPYTNPITHDKPLSLTRALELIYNNGGRTVYAVKVNDLTPDEIDKGLNALMNQNVHIVVAAGVDANVIATILKGHCDAAVTEQKDRIGIVGSKTYKIEDEDIDDIKDIKSTVVESDRLIYVAPGINVYELANKGKVELAKNKIKEAEADASNSNANKEAAESEKTNAENEAKVAREKPVTLPGSYAACAVAGLISSLAVQSSPTNKVLNVNGLEKEYTYSDLKKLIQNNVCVVGRKNGSCVVIRGITTDKGAFQQITTRRIVDKAKAGIRSGSQLYIGKLNNSRVRSALKSTLDGFLTTMVQDEALSEYSLEVTATRQDEINGRCIVTVILKPTFSIDYIKVIMYLS